MQFRFSTIRKSYFRQPFHNATIVQASGRSESGIRGIRHVSR